MPFACAAFLQTLSLAANNSSHSHVCRSGSRINVVASRRFCASWGKRPLSCLLFSRGWLPWDQTMHGMEVSAHEGPGAANPLTADKPLTFGRLVAHRYLVERQGHCRSELYGKSFAIYLVVFIEISEKE
jgi:hypothetical protein